MTRLSTRFTALFPFIVLSHVVLFFSLTASGQCTLCYDGSDPPHPDLVLPDFDDLSCGTLATRAAVISKSSGDDDNDDELCKEYALLGLMCGCPAPEQACTLCEDASPVPNVNKEDLMMIGQYVCKELEWEGNLQSSVDWNLCPAWRASFGTFVELRLKL